jgi:SulP family sulfate permease
MGGLPVSGSYSRTAVNVEAGASSPMSSAIAAIFVGLALLFFTPIFYFLPIPVFASIIVVSALGLIDISEIKFLWKTKARDGFIASITFLATLLFGIHQGVLTGVALSVIAVMYRISRPNVAILGHLDGTRTFRGMRDHGDAKQFAGVLILRIDASFSFANADRPREVIMKQASGQDIRAIILEASSINDLDTTALAILSDTHEALSKREIEFYMSGTKMAVVKVLRSSGVHDTIGVDHFFLSVHRALVHVLTGWNRLDEYVGRLP